MIWPIRRMQRLVEPHAMAPNFCLLAPLAPVRQVSPLCLDQFQLELRNHPDHSAINYVLSGIQHGFHICFDASAVGLQRYTGAPVNRDIFCHDTNIDI